MPDFKKIHEFVTYVHKYNTKDDDEDEATLNNLVDPNYADIKAIKEDNALRKFNELTQYGKVKVANIYKSAKDLGYLEKRDSTNSTHVSGIGIILPEKGKEFIHTSTVLKLKTGKLVAKLNYYYKPLTILGAFLGASVATLIIDLVLRWVNG